MSSKIFKDEELQAHYEYANEIVNLLLKVNDLRIGSICAEDDNEAVKFRRESDKEFSALLRLAINHSQSFIDKVGK